MKPILPFLELMLSSVCNLVCTGCSTYSDLPSRGYVPWPTMKQWLMQWQQRLDIEDIGPMGGEPLIYPDVMIMLQDLRSMFPTSKIRFPTNGTLLHKHWHVVDWLYNDGNATLKITRHIDSEQLEQNIDQVWRRYSWTPVHEYGIDRFCTDTGLRLQVNEPKIFTQTFQGSYTDAQPWYSDPAAAFANCHQQTCPLLHRGRIFKCSTSALLPDALARHDNPNSEQWQSYFDNSLNGSIDLNSDSAAVESFVTNFGQPHQICSQCPSQHHDCYVEHRKLVQWR